MHQQVDTEMGRQSFSLKKNVIGWDALCEIPRNHLDRQGGQEFVLYHIVTKVITKTIYVIMQNDKIRSLKFGQNWLLPWEQNCWVL